MEFLRMIQKKAGLALLFMALLIPGAAASAASTQDVTGTARYDYAFEVLQKVNAQRAAAGVPALTMDADLLNAAMLRAAETVVEFSHVRPNGTLCYTACEKMYGENIAWGQTSPTQVMSSWLSSEEHKKNILESTYKIIGIGCIETTSGIYWVQCFGADQPAQVTQPENATVSYRVSKTPTLETAQINNADAKNEDADTPDATEEVSSVTGLKVKAGKGKLTVKWKGVTDAAGYQIQISTKSSFSKKQTYKVGTEQMKKVIRKCNGKKLKSGKKYYIRIRAYKMSGGETAYSAWTKTSKKVK